MPESPAYCFDAGDRAFPMLVQTDVETAHPSASAPAKADNESAKRNRPTSTASQSSLSLAFRATTIACCTAAEGPCVASAFLPPEDIRFVAHGVILVYLRQTQ